MKNLQEPLNANERYMYEIIVKLNEGNKLLTELIKITTPIKVEKNVEPVKVEPAVQAQRKRKKSKVVTSDIPKKD